MQDDLDLKKMNFDVLNLTTMVGVSAGKKNCYHAAAFGDYLLVDMQHDHVLKKLNIDLLTQSPGGDKICPKYNFIL